MYVMQLIEGEAARISGIFVHRSVEWPACEADSV